MTDLTPPVQFVRPEQVSLRSAWPREDSDFTPWLAENLAYLADVGLEDLELINTEVVVPGVGRQLDILAELPNGNRVAIENQYRHADHDHFTRGLAYAVGLETRTLVIIAESHRDEFIAVADYLNRAAERLDDIGIAIFLVSVRVEKVGEYLIPRFEAVARPNEWRITAHRSLEESGNKGSEQRRREGYTKFWDEFFTEARRQELPIFRNWGYLQQQSLSGPAVSGQTILWQVRLLQGSAIIELMIATSDAQVNSDLLEALQLHEDELSATLGALKWDPKEGALNCSLQLQPIENCGWQTDPATRAASMPQLVRRVRAFYDALRGPLTTSWESISSGK